MLGSNSVARAQGPLSWLPFWRLPQAGGDLIGVGPVSLLPLVSLAAWGVGRRLNPRPLCLGWRRITIPLAALGLWALLSLLLECRQDCPATAAARLLLILAAFFWTYLFILNERPDLFWIVAAIVVVQSSVAVGQFVAQRDLGLRALGELSLAPEQIGISVVLRNGERWLRGYGLTVHPNTLARTLVPCLMMLVVLGRDASERRRVLTAAVFVIGLAGMLAALSRWAWACLLLGLGFSALPWLRETLAGRRPQLGRPAKWTILGGALLLLLFLVFYGNTLVGRTMQVDSSIESRSLWERERDNALAVALIREHGLRGVGFGRYLAAAQQIDRFAETVHNVPLLIAAELGVVGLALWLLLILLPLLRRGTLTTSAAETGLWLSFWLLGLLYLNPHPLYELRSVLLAGMVAALVSMPVIYAASE